MNRLLQSAWVIARRDFVATVWSKTFLLFLFAPILAGAFGLLLGEMTSDADLAASRPSIVVIMPVEDAEALRPAYERVGEAIGASRLSGLTFVNPAIDVDAQARALLSSRAENASAVLAGTLERPRLLGPGRSLDRLAREVSLYIDDARGAAALQGASAQPAPAAIAKVPTLESRGSMNRVQHGLARGSQMLVFFLTLMLATMLLSNLVEEKSNKVIEVLAAAVPLDAVFLGKLIAMLGVSIIGITIWGGLAGATLAFIRDFIDVPVTPAIGWPAFCVLMLIYFASNYMLLGALFLGIGGQASNVREVQTLSMPVSIAQVLIFLLASMVVGDDGGMITWGAMIFPLSSPLTMIALAAQSPTLWWHALAIIWQVLWIYLTIRASAAMFRRTVLKTGSPDTMLQLMRPKKPVIPPAG